MCCIVFIFGIVIVILLEKLCFIGDMVKKIIIDVGEI